MDRLTFDGNFCDIAMCREQKCPYDGSCSQREVWERLKAYEDTGLEPEEIEKAMAISALREQEELDSPLSAFLTPMDSYKGLKRKFLVFKSDTGEMIENCFVLRPGKDPAAVAALRAYAEATDNDTLAADIISWVGAECNDPLTLAEEV